MPQLQDLLRSFGLNQGQVMGGQNQFLTNLLQNRARGGGQGIFDMMRQGSQEIGRATGSALGTARERLSGTGIGGANIISDILGQQTSALGNLATQGGQLRLQSEQAATQQLGQQNLGQAQLAQGLFGGLLQNQQFGQQMTQQQEQFLADLGFRQDQLAEMRRQFDESQEFSFGDFMGKLFGGAAQVGSTALIASDRRVKDNIERVGISLSGVNIYEFNYKGDSIRFRGAMAQENPEASVERNGIKYLDYSKIDVDFEVV